MFISTRANVLNRKFLAEDREVFSFWKIAKCFRSDRGALRWVPSASLGAPEQRRSVVTEERRRAGRKDE